MKKALLIIFSVLALDQTVKVLVKLNMYISEEIHVFGLDWFIIHFTENNGMAFGWEFAGENGKIALSIFRILAVSAIGWYLLQLIKKKEHKGLIICISLIFAGAVGNIIDSAIYGLLFTSSQELLTVAEFSPGNGYNTFLHGRVVDMLYFPVIDGRFPEWFPFWGGESFIFFRPIFNIADASITSGVFALIIFQRKFFKKVIENTEDKEQAEIENTENIVDETVDSIENNK